MKVSSRRHNLAFTSRVLARSRRGTRPMADEIVAHGITREVHRPNAVWRAMAKHPELWFILLSFFISFLSNYGSSYKSKPLVVPAALPEPLFPALSSVLDLYLGDLDRLVEMLEEEDLIFVMYYAPWCAKSHSVVSQFSAAADFLEGQVRFVAVNCWYPEGLCRKQYKFLLYPVFFAYHRSNDGYRYMGIERAEFMVKFLEDLLHPLTLLHKIDQVKDFVTQHDTVVVGYFDFNSSPQPPGFQQFFYASMRVVEHDPYQPVKFGVVTESSLAALCHLSQSSEMVHFRINNFTLRYPLPNNITSTNIVNWVFAGRPSLPVRWVVPLGMKSLSLSREINKGPAVIMFHRVSPLSMASQSYSVFKDLALRYNQCPQNEKLKETTYRWTSLSLRNLLHHAQMLQMCVQYRENKPLKPVSHKCCISTASECIGCLPEAKFNICEICQHWSDYNRPSFCYFENGSTFLYDSTLSGSQLPSNSCLNSIAHYDVSSHVSVCCKRCDKNISFSDFLTAPFYQSSSYKKVHQYSRGRRPTDRYVLDSLESLPRKLCDRFTFQKNQKVFPQIIVPDIGRSNVPEDFTGRGCHANNSLTFITMDSHNHWMFAQRLGLDVSQAHVSPVIVAFDKEKEQQHVLTEKFSKKNTALFILNFTQGLLGRDLRSLPPASHDDCASRPSLCVTELTTTTLHAAINQPQDLVLLVYANWCGVCASLSHVFLHLAHYFHTSSNITFARINGDTNDMPWELTMESYPTIIFFPAYREADSVAFPDHVTPSLPNLVRFVLQHTTFTTRFHLAADVCSTTCIQENLDLSRHTLHALRSKLQHFKIRLRILKFDIHDKKASYYHSMIKSILKRRIEELKEEIIEVKLLIEFLEQNKGRPLDQSGMQRLLQERMHRKDFLQGR